MPATTPDSNAQSASARQRRPSAWDATTEWLLTDGRGGYACGSADALPRRRYHGLWVTRPEGRAKRYMLVADLDERVGPRAPGRGDEGMAHLLHAHWDAEPVATPPQARATFTHRPLPTWTFTTAFGVVERTVALQRHRGDDEPLLLVRWRNLSERALRLEVRPLLGWCDVDHLISADRLDPEGGFDGQVATRGASWGFRPTDELPTLWLSVDGVAAFEPAASWYSGFRYEFDRLRGYDYVGDRWTPGVLQLDIGPGADAVAAFAMQEPHVEAREAFAAASADATARHESAVAHPRPHLARLEMGAEDFLYRGVGERLGVLAGFPWFGEWGRDVFLALPGLTIARGRLDLCEQVMVGCLPFLQRGLLPNIYGDAVTRSRYNSCDAALWFALAVMRYDRAGGDSDLLAERLVPALRGVARAYLRGTELGLVVGPDGMLRAGGVDLNATWMDATTSEGPVTPRQGMPVEIQALWYALLSFLADHGDDDGEYAKRRDACGAAFLEHFWVEDGSFLADRVHDGLQDLSVRPNMLVSAALARSPLSDEQRAAVVEVARAKLVTPCGLRTLAPEDAAYVGVYGGDVETRDRAYHQGTVWPWPVGFYVEASLRAVPAARRGERAAELLAWIEDLLARELDRAAFDHVSEVFDGDEPHRPGGTFAQAWNTGELLRAHGLCVAAVNDKASELL